MKKIFRWALVFLGCLIVLLAVASAVAWYYKPQITQAVHRKLEERINGDFDIRDIGVSILEDFPNVSITLRDVYLRGAQYDRYKKNFFSAKKVQVNVQLGKLLVKEVDVKSIRIVQGNVFAFRTRSGYTNLDVFKAYHRDKADSASRSSATVSVEEVVFDDVVLAFRDSLKEKSFGMTLTGKNTIHRKDSSLEFRYTGKMEVDRLQFNTRKGSYLLGKTLEVKLGVDYEPGAHRLTVLSSSLRLDHSHLDVAGDFVLTPEGNFSLAINSNDLHYEEGLSVLPEPLATKLKRYNVHGPFAVDVKVSGPLAPGSQPAVDIQFRIHETGVTVGKYKAEKVSTKGAYTNHRDEHKPFDDQNSVVHIASFSGIFDRLPMTGEGTFVDLGDPVADIKVSIEGNAAMLQHELDSTRFRVEGGHLLVKLAYLGKLTEYLDPAKSRFGGTLTGKTEVKNVKLVWVPHQTTLDDIQASIDFTQNQFHIGNLSLRYNHSPVTIKGSIVGFVPLFSVPRQKGTIKLEISSPNLNVTPAVAKGSKLAAKNATPTSKKMISDLIDNIYSKLEFELQIKIGQLKYRNFIARQLTGNVTLTGNQLQARSIRMELAGGNVQLSLGLSDLNRSLNPVSVQAVVQQADIHDFFYVFNNFNQKMVGYQNLSGKINAKVTMKGTIDDNLDVLMPTLKGKVELTVRKGKLKNFAPMEKLSSFLFKNRDFADIDFAEINSTFDLRATELTINRMEVQSSVISLFLEGRYSLADSTDLSIQLPLSNLKTRDKTYKPQNVGVDSKVGPSIFLRARRDDNGNISITYDPFKKFRKKRGAR